MRNAPAPKFMMRIASSIGVTSDWMMKFNPSNNRLRMIIASNVVLDIAFFPSIVFSRFFLLV